MFKRPRQISFFVTHYIYIYIYVCLEEKLCILKAKGNNSLNTRSEFYAKCCHKEKFSACKFKLVTIDKPPRQRATVDIDESNTN